MAQPAYINDGNFTRAEQNGPDEWRTPFSDRGDFLTFEVMKRYRVDQAYYKRGRSMEKIRTNKGYAYLVEEGEAVESGPGLLDFVRVYSALPNKRIEGTSIIYSVQFVSTQLTYEWLEPPDTPTISELPITMSAEVEYEYFLTKPKPLIAPRVTAAFGRLIIIGGWGTFTAGDRVLAEDSEVDIYKGGIYVRRSVYIRYPVFDLQ